MVGMDGGGIIFYGGDGSDVLIGGGGNDILYGRVGNDYLFGMGGDDRYFINTGDGTDTIEDKQGINTVFVNDRPIRDFVRQSDGTYRSEDGFFTGVMQSGYFVVTETANNIQVFLNHDFESGDFGIHLLDAPNPWATPATSNTIQGDQNPENPNDTLTDTAGNDVILGGAGDDYIYSDSGGQDWLKGGAGSDLIDGLVSTNTIIEGGAGSDVLLGSRGAGNQIFADSYGDMQTLIDAGETAESTNQKGDLICGGYPGANNFLYGSNGNDLLLAYGGKDLMVGGGGDDLILSDYWSGIGVTPEIVHDWSFTIQVDGYNYTPVISGVYGGGYVDDEGDRDVIYAGTGNDFVDSGGGDDEVHGGTGNDTIFGEAGADYIEGGDGDDVLNGDSGAPSIDKHGADYIDGGSGNDTIWGCGGSDNLLGGDGNDQISGDDIGDEGYGDDYIYGGAGNDTMWGGSGNDTILGGDDDDYLQGDSGAQGDLPGYGDDYLDGGAGNDVLLAGAGDDILLGGDGEDTLFGMAGADVMYGGDGNDSLYGDSSDTPFDEQGDDYIDGEAGNDTIYGYGGNDTIHGGDGNDQIRGGDGDNELYGDDGNDQLWGGSGDDYIDGGSGDDSIRSGLGNDTMDGGAGNDFYYVALGSGEKHIEDYDGYNVLFLEEGFDLSLVRLSLGSLVIGDASGSSQIHLDGVDYDDLVGTSPIQEVRFSDNTTMTIAQLIETVGITIPATEDADDLTGTSGKEVIYALAGDDVVDGRGGNDVLDLGAGDDFAYGGDGNDTITGDEGADTLFGEAGNDLLDGGAGIDTMIGGLGDDTYIMDSPDDVVTENPDEGTDCIQTSFTYTLQANVENLTLTGTAAVNGTGNELNNVLTGNSGDNVLDGGLGADTLIGGQGNDTYIVDSSDDVIVENADEGVDSVQSTAASYILSANIENLTLVGASAISGTGNDSANLIVGNDLNNVLDGGAGLDTMIGGIGDDTYVVDDAQDTIVELSGEGVDTVESSVNYVLGDNLENHTLTGSAASATGNSADNILTGNDADNRLDGGAGADTMIGGLGDDTYVLDNPGDVVIEQADGGNDTVETSVSFSVSSIPNIENVTLTGTADVDATGDDGVNRLLGNSGNNVLDGGLGADYMAGGAGNDVYTVDDEGDTVYEADNEGIDTIIRSFDTLYVLDSNIENLTLTGEVYRGNGNELDNVITGNDAENNLWGMEGNDTLIGAGGNDALFGDVGVDTLIGGSGDDYYEIDNAADTIIENADEGDDFVRSTVSYTLGDNVERLAVDGTDDLTVTGNSLDNGLWGNLGNNILTGGAGNDYLVGDQGNDVYVFNRGDGQDSIDNTDVLGTIDTLRFGSGVGVNDVLAFQYDTHLFFKIKGTTDQIGFIDYYGENTTIDGQDADHKIDRVEFADGTVWDQAMIQTVVDRANNDNPPSVHTWLPTLHAKADSLFTYTVPANTITDSDVWDSITYSITMADGSAVPTWLNFDPVTLVLSGTPGVGDEGTLQFVLWGWDNYGYAAGEYVTITIGAPNRAPVLSTALADKSAAQGAALSYTVPSNSFTDPDGDTLTYSATLADGSPLPSWLNFNPATRVFSGTPPDSGTVSVKVTATDPYNLATSDVFDIVVTLQNLTINGTSSADVLSGGAGNDTINGQGGNDTLNGLAGNDSLNGGTGADIMYGGLGDDTYVVDNTGDVVTENAGEGTDTVQSSITYTLAANVENLTLTGSSAINGTGNALDNVLIGNSGANTLTGAAGNDILDGGTGADRLVGGTGNDTYVVDNTGDVVVENTGEGTDTVQSSITYTLGSNVENLTLTGSSAINGTGNTLDNVLTGNSAANTLTGGTGNDTLNGGAGNDTLNGGAGNDTYLLGRGDGGDTISDYDTTSGNTDTLMFGSDIAPDQLWLSRSGNDLQVSVIGTEDKATISGWYNGTAYQTEEFKTSDGHTLLNSQVDSLVSAMAAFAPPPPGQTTLPDDYRTALQPLIAANWR